MFRGQLVVTWHSPDLPNHDDMALTDIVWSNGPGTPAFSFTDPVCAFGVNCTAIGSGTAVTTRNVPLTMPAIPVNGSFNIRLNFKFDGHGARPSLPASPSAVTKMCMSYRILSEPTVTKKCNIVGQTGSTANPTNCD